MSEFPHSGSVANKSSALVHALERAKQVQLLFIPLVFIEWLFVTNKLQSKCAYHYYGQTVHVSLFVFDE